MANKVKTYHPATIKTVEAVGTFLKGQFNAKGLSLKTLSAASGLSVNSIKSILKGATANIASYDALARALGTDLISIMAAIKAAPEVAPADPTFQAKI
jgi:transcriptional regulator with XRE-family HTH domain